MTEKSFWSFLFSPKIWRGFPTNRQQRSSSADPQSFRKHWTQGKGNREYFMESAGVRYLHTSCFCIRNRIFTCENHSSLLWLARTHLRIKIYNTTFWGVFLSMYIIKRTSQRCTRRRKHFRGPENKEHQPRRGKRRTKRREQFSLRWCSKSGNPNDDYIWWSAALLLKEDGCDWVQPRTWTRKSGKLHKLTARAIDCKTVGFFLKIGLAYLSVRVA